jgi:lysozyme
LADIAALYSTTVEELLRLNDLPEPNLLYTGQAIVVPGRAAPPPELPPATSPPPEPSPPPTANVHVVKEGETLGLIAERYGTTVEVLLELNDLPDPNVVPVGTSLIVPQPP